MPEKPSIRPFAAADLPALQAIRAAAFAPVFASFRQLVGDEIFSVALGNMEREQAEHLDKLCAEAPGEMLIAIVNGEIVGFAHYTLSAETQTGEIGLNAVHPRYAGQGIGAAMYEEALTRMKAAGMKVAAVATGADDSHAPARRAYAKAGFGPSVPSVFLYRKL